MKKPILKLMLMLCLINVYGQNVKIKKDVLSIDKKDICKFKETERNHYTVQDLDSHTVFNIEFESETVATLDGDAMFSYLKFKKPDSDAVYYCDYDLTDIKISFSGDKTLARHLISKNQFLNENGINYVKTEDFFSKPQPRNIEIEEKTKLYKIAYQEVEDFNLKIVGNKIYKVGEKDTLVGSFKFEAIPNFNDTRIKFFDAKGFFTATYELGNIIFFDSNKIKFKLISRDNTENVKRVVERMIIAGYTLGDMQSKKAQIRLENHREEVKAEKKTSSNIYNEKATVYNEDGSTVNGEITLEFYELESQKSGMSSIQNYGGVASLKAANETGKYSTKNYKAKEGLRFCIDATNECYRGVKTNGLTAPKFNLEIDVSGSLKLYESKFANYYIIKKEDTEKGLIVDPYALFKGDNSKKMFEDIFEYLSDCPSLKNSLDISNIDLKNVDDLKKIVTTYNNCK